MYKIYINDDNKPLVTWMISRLEREWYEVVHDFAADLYILDLNINGEMAYNKIREVRDKTKWIIVVYSWYSWPDYRRRSYESWAHGYIDKADSPDLFAAQIRALLSLKERLCGKKSLKQQS